MTISWGGLGTLWRRPVATVYVKKNRYTFEFMEQNDYFTVSFYPQEQRRPVPAGQHLRPGRRQGGGGADAGVPAPGHHLPPGGDHPGLPQALLPGLRPGPDPRDVQDIFYRDEPVHRMYIGEVVDIIGNESLANRP